jgi:hypothetical protein
MGAQTACSWLVHLLMQLVIASTLQGGEEKIQEIQETSVTVRHKLKSQGNRWPERGPMTCTHVLLEVCQQGVPQGLPAQHTRVAQQDEAVSAGGQQYSTWQQQYRVSRQQLLLWAEACCCCRWHEGAHAAPLLRQPLLLTQQGQEAAAHDCIAAAAHGAEDTMQHSWRVLSATFMRRGQEPCKPETRSPRSQQYIRPSRAPGACECHVHAAWV